MTIAILEDSAQQANTVSSLLQKSGHRTIVLSNGDNFIEYASKNALDLMLLDWDVPGKNGIEVLQWTRRNLSGGMPVVMMTQHDAEEDIIFALDNGADDYLTKPIRAGELVARINAQIRKNKRFYGREDSTSSTNEKIVVGKYALDVAARSVYIGEDSGVNARPAVSLSEREMQLIALLFKNVGRIVSKDHLIRQIWGCAPDRKYDASLSTYTSKLRRLLGLTAENNLLITTIYNYGYRLECA